MAFVGVLVLLVISDKLDSLLPFTLF